MKIAKFSLLMVGILITGACFSNALSPSVTKISDVSITVKPKKIDENQFVILVSVHNSGKSELLINDPDSAVTREAWTVSLHDPSGAKLIVKRIASDITVFKVKTIKIQPESSRDFTLNIRDESWDWPREIGSGEADKVSVLLNVPNSRMWTREGIWTGHKESPPIEMGISVRKMFPNLVAIYD